MAKDIVEATNIVMVATQVILINSSQFNSSPNTKEDRLPDKEPYTGLRQYQQNRLCTYNKSKKTKPEAEMYPSCPHQSHQLLEETTTTSTKAQRVLVWSTFVQAVALAAQLMEAMVERTSIVRRIIS